MTEGGRVQQLEAIVDVMANMQFRFAWICLFAFFLLCQFTARRSTEVNHVTKPEEAISFPINSTAVFLNQGLANCGSGATRTSFLEYSIRMPLVLVNSFYNVILKRFW